MVNQIISTYLEENIRLQSQPSYADQDEEDEDENFQKREKT